MRSIFAQESLSHSLSFDRKVDMDYPFDPNLLPTPKNLLPEFKNPAEQEAYANFLARKIKRNPKDLQSHAQRIHLCYSLKNEEAYFGAVVDLLITLGPKGLSLKKSILRPTYSLLKKEHARFINQHLQLGITATQLIPTRESRLSKGTSSTKEIITGKFADGKEYNSLSVARQKLSVGEVETAQVILENALEADPGNIEITNELLELYSNHQLRKAFVTMSTRLTGKALASSEKWLEIEQLLLET